MQHLKFTHTVVLLMILCGEGCSSNPDVDAQTSDHQQYHSHEEHAHSGRSHDHPEDFASAVKQIQTLNDTIRTAFIEDDMNKADPPVHQIGHILESIHSLSEQASFSEEDQKSIDTAVESLFEAFAAIDEKLHGGKGATYSDVEAKIKPAIELLREKAKSQGEMN